MCTFEIPVQTTWHKMLSLQGCRMHRVAEVWLLQKQSVWVGVNSDLDLREPPFLQMMRSINLYWNLINLEKIFFIFLNSIAERKNCLPLALETICLNLLKSCKLNAKGSISSFVSNKHWTMASRAKTSFAESWSSNFTSPKKKSSRPLILWFSGPCLDFGSSWRAIGRESTNPAQTQRQTCLP